MFNSKNQTTKNGDVANGMATIIAAGTEIKGDIESNGDIRVDGTLKGNLNTSARVIVGADGYVQGDVIAQQADVHGKVSGKITVKELLYLKGDASINGDIYTGQLQVDPSASFNGKCHMGSSSSSKTSSDNDVSELLSEKSLALNG